MSLQERDGPKREEGSGRDLQEQQQQEQPEKVEENHTESDGTYMYIYVCTYTVHTNSLMFILLSVGVFCSL